MSDLLDLWTPTTSQPELELELELEPMPGSAIDGDVDHEQRPLSTDKVGLKKESQPMERPPAMSSFLLPLRPVPTTIAVSSLPAPDANISLFEPSNQNDAPPTPAAPLPSPRALSKDSEGNFEEAPTAGIRACGSNCKRATYAESKPKGNHYDCKKCASLFIPKKSNSRRLRTLPGRIAKTRNVFGMIAVKDEAADTQFVEAEKKSHEQDGNVHLRKEDPDEALIQLTKAMNQRERTILMPRELINLQVDGTAALRDHGPIPRKNTHDGYFSIPDPDFGKGPAKRQKAEASEWRAEHGEAAATRPEDVETYCICDNPWDWSLESCSMCDEYFHPACLGQEEREVGKKSKRDRFLCFNCQQQQEENEVRAAEAEGRNMKPKTIAELRRATIEKREFHKAWKRQIEKDFGKDTRIRKKKPEKEQEVLDEMETD